MAKKPELTKISPTSYKCSECEFTVEIIRPDAITAVQWEQRLANHLSEHIRQQHSREDMNQATQGRAN